MNDFVAYWPPTSVVVTVVPEVPLGTEKVQLNVPVALVVREPVVQLVIATLSNTNATVLDTEYRVPDTVTDEPTGPWAGVTVIFGTVTVNGFEACCP